MTGSPERSVSAIVLSLVALPLTGLVAFAPTALAAVPGANGKIAFTSDRDGHDQIYVMNPDGSDPTRLTTSGGAQPAWSPDGLRIAYVAAGDIYIMDASGGRQTRLTFGGPAEASSSPSWSPDGSRIAFARDNDIYVMNTDGSEQSLLIDDASAPPAPGLMSGLRSPTWSPDGARITMIQFSTSGNPLSSSSRLLTTDAAGEGAPVRCWAGRSLRSAPTTGHSTAPESRLGPSQIPWGRCRTLASSRPTALAPQ